MIHAEVNHGKAVETISRACSHFRIMRAVLSVRYSSA